MAIGSLLLATATVLIVLVLALTSSTYGFRAGKLAEGAAMAGIEDAELQLLRNVSYASAGYTVSASGGTATVTVTQGSPSAGYVSVLSVATISNVTRRFSALFSENATTTQINLVSITQLQ